MGIKTFVDLIAKGFISLFRKNRKTFSLNWVLKFNAEERWVLAEIS